MRVKRHPSGRADADRPYRYSSSKRISQNKTALLETIEGFYAAALDRLPIDEMPGLIPRLLKAGLCVGFADPISNIIVNTVSSYSRRKPQVTSVSDDGDKEKTARRRRRKALSRAVNGTRKVNYWPPPRFLLPDMSVADPSLVALVTFLTYYFRALPVWEALEYLRLANADLLCAVRLVEDDLNSTGVFSFGSRTTKTALMCAAIAACHPKPRALVNRSYSLASRMEFLVLVLASFTSENEGAKIVHPDLEKYVGRDITFERMACHDDLTIGSICYNEFIIDFVDVCEEDCIYFDASRDAKCAEFLNARAIAMQGARLV